MRTKMKIIVISFILLILTAVCVLRIIYVNKQYSIIDRMSEQNDEITYNGYQMSISNVTMWDYDDYFNYISDEFSNSEQYRASCRENYEQAIITMDVQIKKISDEDTKFDISLLRLVKDAFHTAATMPLVNEYNAECNKDYKPIDELKSGESTSIHFVYMILSANFTEKDWDNRDKLAYELDFGVYPEKTGFILSNIEVKDVAGDNINTEEQLSDAFEEQQELWEMYDMEERNVYSSSEWVQYDGLEIRLNNIRQITDLNDIDNYNESYCIREIEFTQDMPYVSYWVEVDLSVKNQGDDYSDLCIGTFCPAMVLEDNSFSYNEVYYIDERQHYDKSSKLVNVDGHCTMDFKLICEICINQEEHPNSTFDMDKLYYAINPFGHELNFSDINIKFIKCKE